MRTLIEGTRPMLESGQRKKTRFAQWVANAEASLQAVPTWELATLLVGFTLFALAMVVMSGPVAGSVTEIDRMFPGEMHRGVFAFGSLCMFCSAMIIGKPHAKIAPLFSFPLLIWAGSVLRYVLDHPDIANLGTPVVLIAAGLVAWVAMTKGR